MKKFKDPRRCLQYAGIMGHAWAVVEPCDPKANYGDDWRIVAHCNSLESAVVSQNDCEDALIYRMGKNGWELHVDIDGNGNVYF